MATPTTPATPMLTALAGAAADLLVVAGFEPPVVVVAGRVVGVVAGAVVATGTVVGTERVVVMLIVPEVVPEELPVPELVLPVLDVPDAVPEDEPEAFRQEVSPPAWMVKAADWPEVPVLSLIVRPRDVPTGKLTVHVRVLPVCVGKLNRGGAVGWLPGRMLKKYGGVPPLQVKREGWQTTGLLGVMMLSWP